MIPTDRKERFKYSDAHLCVRCLPGLLKRLTTGSGCSSEDVLYGLVQTSLPVPILPRTERLSGVRSWRTECRVEGNASLLLGSEVRPGRAHLSLRQPRSTPPPTPSGKLVVPVTGVITADAAGQAAQSGTAPDFDVSGLWQVHF